MDFQTLPMSKRYKQLRAARRHWPEWDDPNEGIDGNGKPYGPRKAFETARRRRQGKSIPAEFKTNFDMFYEQTGKPCCTIQEFFGWLADYTVKPTA